MKKIIVGMMLITGLISCGRFQNKEIDGTKDLRIVSLSKHLTEFSFSLGKGHNIIGVVLIPIVLNLLSLWDIIEP